MIDLAPCIPGAVVGLVAAVWLWGRARWFAYERRRRAENALADALADRVYQAVETADRFGELAEVVRLPIEWYRRLHRRYLVTQGEDGSQMATPIGYVALVIDERLIDSCIVTPRSFTVPPQ